jgi:hypothetical protein
MRRDLAAVVAGASDTTGEANVDKRLPAYAYASALFGRPQPSLQDGPVYKV